MRDSDERPVNKRQRRELGATGAVAWRRRRRPCRTRANPSKAKSRRNRRGAALRAAVGRGAQVVAAGGAEAGATKSARAEHPPRRRRSKEQGKQPVWNAKDSKVVIEYESQAAPPSMFLNEELVEGDPAFGGI